jgi:Putative collagen-binding domain of a collagenase
VFCCKAGGAGIEYYFGYGHENSDMTCEDFRTRANMWSQSRYALEFFHKNNIEFWNMFPTAARIPKGSTDWAMVSQDSDVLVIYRRVSHEFGVYLNGLVGRFIVEWYNPREGGSIQDGTVTTIIGGNSDAVDYGLPPDSNDKDWIVLLRRVSK